MAMLISRHRTEELRRNYHMAVRCALVGDTFGLIGCFLIIGTLRSEIFRDMKSEIFRDMKIESESQTSFSTIDKLVYEIDTVRQKTSEIIKMAIEGKDVHLEDFGIDPETYEFAFELEDKY